MCFCGGQAVHVGSELGPFDQDFLYFLLGFVNGLGELRKPHPSPTCEESRKPLPLSVAPRPFCGLTLHTSGMQRPYHVNWLHMHF